jgi:negative regulator of sigma-B (phosphoserine phosphatase)
VLALSATSDGCGIDWGVAGRPFPGELESGDLHVAVELPDGILLAVIDGIGHGSEAAEAARLAATTLQAHASETLSDAVRSCDAALKGSCGVALTIARIGLDGTLTWVGVGDGAGVLWRRSGSGFSIRSMAPLGRGVLGSHLPPLHEKQISLLEDDLLLLCSDGIVDAAQWTPALLDNPTRAAETILVEQAREDDDALALVARYAGS